MPSEARRMRWTSDEHAPSAARKTSPAKGRGTAREGGGRTPDRLLVRIDLGYVWQGWWDSLLCFVTLDEGKMLRNFLQIEEAK